MRRNRVYSLYVVDFTNFFAFERGEELGIVMDLAGSVLLVDFLTDPLQNNHNFSHLPEFCIFPSLFLSSSPYDTHGDSQSQSAISRESELERRVKPKGLENYSGTEEEGTNDFY